MTGVRPSPLPPGTLLAAYAERGAYADCWAAEIPGPVSHARFVEVFYTGRVFKLERWLIAMFLSRPASDLQARQLGLGEIETFAAWRVEARTANELLLCDIGGRTRSWLMAEPTAAGTRLFFGSAVVPAVARATGRRRMGFLFTALLGFHKLYSRVLLGAACARLSCAQA